MNYNLRELETYIKANKNITLEQYKNNLISIESKYPHYVRITYDLLENNQVLAYINNSNGNIVIELGIEIRDKIIFVEN